MMKMRVKVKWIPRALKNRPEWDKETMQKVLPLLKVARMVAGEVRSRVVNESRDADGKKFSRYADNRTEAYIFWVPTTMPQPVAGRVAETKSGMVGYRSSLEYHKHVHMVSNKNFYVTGKMWKSLRVRPMTPTRVRIAFYGSSEGWFKKGAKGRKTRNADKAYYAAQRENLGVLWVSDEEAERVYKILEEVYAAKLAVLLRMDDAAFTVAKTAAKIERRIKRSEAKMRKLKRA